MWFRQFAWSARIKATSRTPHIYFDRVDSYKVVAAPFALPGRSFRIGVVLVFEHRSAFYVARARNRRLCKFRGRCSVLWTLQKH